MRFGQPATHVIGMAETKSQSSPSKKSRRKSDPYGDNFGASSSRNNPSVAAGTRDPRPPPSTRGFSSIPPSAVPPPVLGGRLPGPLPQATIAPSLPSTSSPVTPTFAPSLLAPATAGGSAVLTASAQPSRDSSAASLPGLTPTSTRLPVSVPDTPAPKSPVGFPFPELVSPAGIRNTRLDILRG